MKNQILDTKSVVIDGNEEIEDFPITNKKTLKELGIIFGSLAGIKLFTKLMKW